LKLFYRYKEIKIIEEVSVKTQMNKIRCLEKGFMATHLTNIGAKIRSIRKAERKKGRGVYNSN